MFDEIFAEHAKDVKASIRTPADAKGRSVTLKLDVAPSGAIEDDEAWLEACEQGVTLSERLKEASGRTRTKSLKTGKEETCTQIGRIVLGLDSKKAKKRSQRADTIPSENGTHTEQPTV